MKTANADALGMLTDIVDTLARSVALDVPAELQVDTMRRHLPLLRDSLRRIVISETGNNPWKSTPCAH